MENNKKILVVDDEIKITEVIKSYLEKDGFEVVCAYNGATALEVFNKEVPSLIILDLMLPDVSGEDVCKKIRTTSRVPVIMLTAKVKEENVLEGFDLGADDYVTKPFSTKQLVARVKALLRRTDEDRVSLTNIMSFNHGELVVDDTKHEVTKFGVLVNLTPNEYKILFTMIKYPKKAFTREELVCIALGDDYDGFDRVIDTHIKNLRQKLETNVKEPRYILTVHGVGYKFGGD